MSNNKLMKAILLGALALVVGVFQHFQKKTDAPPSTSQPNAATTVVSEQGIEQIRAARTNPNAKFWITVQGKVLKSLLDDTAGDRHQRFLVKFAPDVVLLVAHNIDIAPRVPVQVNQSITVSGEFIANDRGGLMHWTHHDPQGHQGGWVQYNGRRYE